MDRTRWIVEKCGRSYNLERLGYQVIDHDGLDMPVVESYSNQPPQIDGVVDLGFRLRERTWLIKVLLVAERSEYAFLRQQLLSIFRPERVESQMRVVQPDGREYAIDFRVTGQMLATAGRRDGTRRVVHQAVIPLRSANPTWYDPDEKVHAFSPLATTAGYDVPSHVATHVGQSLYNSRFRVDYRGTYRAQPVLRVYGPIQAPVVENVTTGERIPLTQDGGLTLAEGEWVEIDTRANQKRIVDYAGVSARGWLAENHDLATFHLAYDGEYLQDGSCADGTNLFRLTGIFATTATRLEVRYHRRFIGI